MKRDSRARRHFSKKQPHTEIKHAIFAEVLKTSLYIANILVRSKDEAFTYIDLFAGRGDFEDDEEGSPMIAFDTIERHILQQSGPGNHFGKIQIVAIDNDEETAKHLREGLGQRRENSMVQKEALEVYTGDRNWETYDTEIRQLLSSLGGASSLPIHSRRNWILRS